MYGCIMYDCIIASVVSYMHVTADDNYDLTSDYKSPHEPHPTPYVAIGRGLTYANGRPYFATYQDSLFDLYVLVTTANSPDIM